MGDIQKVWGIFDRTRALTRFTVVNMFNASWREASALLAMVRDAAGLQRRGRTLAPIFVRGGNGPARILGTPARWVNDKGEEVKWPCLRYRQERAKHYIPSTLHILIGDDALRESFQMVRTHVCNFSRSTKKGRFCRVCGRREPRA